MRINYLLILLTSCTLLLIQPVSAQYSETIRTARPGQAVGPFTTGKGIFQTQAGVNYNKVSTEIVNTYNNQFNFFNIFRYGVSEKWEIRTAFGYNNNRGELLGIETSSSGLSLWNASVRWNALDNAGTRKPSIGLQADLAFPGVSEDFGTDNPSPRFMLIHGQSLTDNLSLTTNWSIQWDGNSGEPIGGYVINFAFPLTDNLGSFVEAYGTVVEGDTDIKFDTGLGYLINPDFQLDISVGYGVNDEITEFFIDGGVSFRIPTVDNYEQ